AGRVHPAVLAAAKLIEADAVFRIGGAHALAAFAFGTASIPKVDMLAGPGGSYVVVAKRLLYGVVGVDLLPGPSEIFIIADESADPFIVASDMLAQAEHGEDSVAILATPEDELIDATREALVKLLESSPRRKLIAQALSQFGAFIRTRNLDEAVEICNQYAPEHVELLVADAFTTAMSIQHAGAVFIGANSPVVAGDYMAGPSHVLPTGGAARFLSGLSPATFTKCVHYVALSREDMEGLADAVMQFAELEGLHCHANAMRLRLTHFNAPKAMNKGGC
ncbi:MAG TPA: histidinol dehydrogenase, partial [Armatimonadetes bacterium]|nr:histidinol dehydrogenase [Armatimonadota bacterium]